MNYDEKLMKKVTCDKEGIILSTSASKALSGPHAEDVQQAQHQEVKNMTLYNAYEGVHFDAIPQEYRDEIIAGPTLMMDTYDKGTGAYVKSKARTIAHGSYMKPGTNGDTAMEMVNVLLVFILLTMAVAIKAVIICFDVQGAFLSTTRTIRRPLSRYSGIRKIDAS